MKLNLQEILKLSKEWLKAWEISEKLYWDKSKSQAIHYHISKSKFKEALEENWFKNHDWNHWWLKVDWASIHIKNDKWFNWKEVIDWVIEKIKQHSINYNKIEYKTEEKSYCQIIDPADHHFWKYWTASEVWKDYNLNIASSRFEEWIKELLNLTKGFHKDKIIFVVWNDVLHTDNAKRTTTSWTPQDTDWQWHEAFDNALACHVKAIETLQQVAPVEVIYNPSNHDFISWYMFAQTLKAWFNKNPNITWNTDMRHRKYTCYWNSMLWFNHWDWAKEKDMGIIMATESPKLWAESKHRYIYLHHMHHKIAKDQIWVTVEYMRSASWTDAWHDRNWYLSKPAMDSILISKNKGQVWRFTHYF